MAITDFPWFPIHADETLSDENFTVWTLGQRGAWLTLLIHCWKEGSVPSDIDRLSRLCGCNAQEMHEHWTGIADRFRTHPDHPERLISPRLERERQRAMDISTAKSEHGKWAAKSRWDKQKKEMPMHYPGNAQPMPTDANIPLPLHIKDVPPTPLQGEPKKKSRRSRGEILAPYSEAVRQVANTVLKEWHKADPGGRPITPDPALLCANVDAVMTAAPEVDSSILIQAARNYLAREKQAYCAPQFFFGVGKPGGSPPHWVSEVRMVLHQQARATERQTGPTAQVGG